MKNSLRLIAALIFCLLFTSSSVASATEIPLLTWEKGKSQSVVLGGGANDANWKVFLKSSQSSLIELSPSLSNKAGFKVYSLTVPRDIPEGSYSIITVGDGSPEALVAAVEIVQMQKYEVTRVPGDLIFILLTIAFWLSALSALRSREFREVKLLISTGPKERYLAGEPAEDFIEHVHEIPFLEKLRIRVYELIPESILKHLLKSDSRGLHLEFPKLWSSLPVLSVIFGLTFGYLTRNSNSLGISDVATILILGLCFIGSLDIYSGILAAISFFSLKLWLLTDFSISAILISTAIALLFFLPALFSSFLYLLLNQSSFGQKSALAYRLLSHWLVPLAILHALVLIQKSLSGESGSTIGVELLMAVALLSGRGLESYLSRSGIKWRSKVKVVEEVKIHIGRLVSPLFVVVSATISFSVFYTWTLDVKSAWWITFLLATPLTLLLVRPTWNRNFEFLKVKLNFLIQILLVMSSCTFLLFFLRKLPLVAGSNPVQYIAFGLIPVYLHSIFAFLSDSGSKRESEIAA